MEQVRVRSCSRLEQPLHAAIWLSICFAPGEHTPWPVQEPEFCQELHEPQPHDDVQVRVRICFWLPQSPQETYWVCVSDAPGEQTP